LESFATTRLFKLAGTILATTVCLSAALAADPANEQENLLRHSLQVSIDVALRDEMAAADADWKSGDIAAASERWLRLLETQQPEALFADGEAFLSAHTAIVRRLKTLTDEQRATYLRLAEPRAAALLSRASSSGALNELARLGDCYPLTASGQQALRQAAGLAFDEGMFFECAAMLDVLFRESPVVPSAEERMRLAVSLRRLGRISAAVNVWRQARKGDQAASVQEFLAHPALKVDFQILDHALAEAIRGAGPDRSLVPQEQPAASSPSWEFEISEAPDAGASFSRLVHDFEKVAHPLLTAPNCDDVKSGVFGGANSVVRLNTQGEKLWQFDRTPTPEPAEMVRRSLGESIQARVSVLGGHVFSVDQWHLKARDLDSGQIVWSTSQSLKEDVGRDGRVFALGLPAVLQNDLSYLVEVDEEIRFVVADLKTGKTRWALKLGKCGLPRAFDPRRSWMPALICPDGGRVICATGNGGLAAVDVLNRRIEWIRAVSREDWRDAGPPRASTPPMSPRMRLWSGWRQPALESIGSQIVWTSPEADSLIALNRETGATIWNLPRGPGLATAASGDAILVLETERIRRVQLANGEDLWSVGTGPIAGTGAFHHGKFFVPIRDVGVTSLRMTDGQSRCGVAWREIDRADRDSNTDLRSLQILGQRLVSQRGNVVRSESLILEETGESADPASGEESVQALVDLAKRQAERGEQAGARLIIGRAIEKSDGADREKMLETCGRLLLAQCVAPLSGNEAREVAQSLRGVGRATLDIDLKSRMFAQCMRLARDPQSALEWLTAACEREANEGWIEADDGSRVRADRYAISLLTADSQGRELSPPSKAAVQAIYDDWVSSGAAQRADRLVNLLFDTDWGARTWLDSIEATRPDLDLQRSATRVAILMKLEALKTLDPALSDRIDAIRNHERAAESPSPTWPTRKPHVSIREWDWPVDTHPILTKPVGAGANSINVELSSGGQSVRFSGDGQGRPWAVSLFGEGKLSRSERSLQMYAEHQRAWLTGDFAVVQAGSELYGIDPLPAGGVRSAELIWPESKPTRVDTLDDVSNMNVAFLPRLSEGGPGSHHEGQDEFGRPLAQVGPMRLNYLAIRQFNRLVAFQTATGARLWERPGFGKRAVAYGDENVIAIVSPDSATVDVLRPLDGRTIGSWDRRFPVESLIGVVDRTAFILQPGAEREIQAIDLADGRVQWRAVVDAAAIGFLIESRFVGVLEPGRLRFFDQTTGSIVATREVAAPPNCESVQVIADSFALIVLASAAPGIEQSRPPLVYLAGYRRPWVNGVIFGFDPQTLDVRWTRPDTTCVVPFDQARDIPIWFLEEAEAGPEAEENQARPSKVRGYDKRTGEEVFDFTPGTTGRAMMTIERDQSAGWIDFRASRKILRLDYGLPQSAAE
jgi:outer membrane protein assembly factor BamB